MSLYPSTDNRHAFQPDPSSKSTMTIINFHVLPAEVYISAIECVIAFIGGIKVVRLKTTKQQVSILSFSSLPTANALLIARSR